MSKPIRYKDGTLMMPGSDAHELDATWRKHEGRPPKDAPATS